MSLEDRIAELTKAVEANTAALLKGGGATAAAPKAAAPKAEAKGYEAKHTADEMRAAVEEVKAKLGTPEAKSLIKSATGKDKLAEVTDAESIDKLYEAAKAKLKAAEDDV